MWYNSLKQKIITKEIHIVNEPLMQKANLLDELDDVAKKFYLQYDRY